MASDSDNIDRQANSAPDDAHLNPSTINKEEDASSRKGETAESLSSATAVSPERTAQNGTAESPPEETPKAAEPEKPGDVPGDARSKLKVALIMSSLCIAVFLAALDVTIITTALPTISEHFHSSAGYTWIGSAYLLGNSASTPSWGKISDIWGRKPALLIANAVFFIGSLIAGLSVNIGMLIAARAIQGIGGGGLITLVNICISDLFSMRSRGKYFGMIGGVWAIASSLGPMIGGSFTEKVSWRWCFYINLPLDGIAFLIILFLLDIQTPKTPLVQGLMHIDWIGSFTVVGGTLLFLFGLEFGGISFPWSSPTVICLLVFGVFSLVLFVLNEWKLAKYPVMPLRIYKSQNNLASLGVCFFHGFVFIAGSYYLPLYFQAVIGATPILSGVYTLATAVPLSIASIGTGIFIKKTGLYRPPIWFGMFMMTLGYGLFINFDAKSSWAKIILYQIIQGLGVGPNFQAPLIALQSGINPRDTASATASFAFIRQLATAISVVIGGVVYQNQVKTHYGTLVQALGPQLAHTLGANGAGANVALIQALPPQQREVARSVFAQSLQPMWIMYCCFAAMGLVSSCFIKKRTLTKQHQVNKTGIEAEKERAAEAQLERRLKRESRATKGMSAGLDDEKEKPKEDV